MKKLIVCLARDTEGQDLIEYALLATLIALACISAIATLGSVINAKYVNLGAALPVP